MLSLRLAIFAGLFGIALWGLFSLLDNLREPKLLCQKSLFDKYGVPASSVFKITVDTRSGAEHLIGGVVNNQRFTCTLRGGKVIDARIVEAQQ